MQSKVVIFSENRLFLIIYPLTFWIIPWKCLLLQLMKYEELWKPLTNVYEPGEAKAIARYLLEVRYGLTMTDIVCGGVERLPEGELEGLRNRLLKAEPVQYVAGLATFGPRLFRVTNDVLIPRPETYELCQWVKEKRGERREERGEKGEDILDIGTGSGCIAVTLAAEIPHATVTAWDISGDALSIAKENAQRNGVHVTFEQRDILSTVNPQLSTLTPLWSIIVSNPPYICPDEQKTMDKNVLAYEPHLALFVPQAEPLLFYQAISHYARHALKPNGYLYFEANPLYIEELQVLLCQEGFNDIAVRDDQFGKHRFIMGRKGHQETTAYEKDIF